MENRKEVRKVEYSSLGTYLERLEFIPGLKRSTQETILEMFNKSGPSFSFWANIKL